MKRLLVLSLFLLSGVAAFAQPRYGVIQMPLCWTVSGQDSSITRYVLASSVGAYSTILYLDAAGNEVVPVGGTMRNGHCDCCEGGNISADAICRDTVEQAGHGFSVGDAIYWNGTAYENMEGNYGDSDYPIGIVTDSISGKDFIYASCGILNTDFGLPDGLYYATDTGLSLAPDTVEFPILKVYDEICQVLAMPGLEFDATGKPLFDIVTVTGQRTIEGGDTMDLHADSIRVSITIADTTATDVGHALELLRNNSSEISGLTTNVIPKATSATEIGNGSITDDGTKVQMTKPIGLLNWATGSEPGSPSAGWIGYNSTLNLPAFRLASTWESPAFGTLGNTQIMYGSATSGRFTSTSIFTYTSGILRVQNITINGAGATYGDTGVGFSLPGITRRLEMNGNPATTDESMLSLRTGGMSGSTLNDRIALLVFPGTVASSATSVTRFTIAKDSAFVNKAMDLFVGRSYAPNFDGNTITKHVAQNWKSGQVGLGTTLPQDIEPSALFEMKSTTQGFLPPRMTGAQAEAIATPAEGLMVYATDGSGITITTKGWWGYDGATWVKLN